MSDAARAFLQRHYIGSKVTIHERALCGLLDAYGIEQTAALRAALRIALVRLEGYEPASASNDLRALLADPEGQRAHASSSEEHAWRPTGPFPRPVLGPHPCDPS